MSPRGRDDDIGSAARRDLVQYPNARGVQIPVPIPSSDRGQHAVDVEKDHPSRHVLGDDPWEATIGMAVRSFLCLGLV